MHASVAAYKRVNELADRWVRAWGAGYTHGWATCIGYREDVPLGPRFVLRAQPDYGGIGCDTWFAAHYLEDDSGLEEVARAWKVKADAERAAEWALEKQLEANPDVQAYLKLKRYHPYGNQVFC
jgi:hypothetical protein